MLQEYADPKLMSVMTEARAERSLMTARFFAKILRRRGQNLPSNAVTG